MHKICDVNSQIVCQWIICSSADDLGNKFAQNSLVVDSVIEQSKMNSYSADNIHFDKKPLEG